MCADPLWPLAKTVLLIQALKTRMLECFVCWMCFFGFQGSWLWVWLAVQVGIEYKAPKAHTHTNVPNQSQ